MTDASSLIPPALLAYSEGRIGWRSACRELRLLDPDELQEALTTHGLRQPAADEADPQQAKRFADFLLSEAKTS